ncbi:ammonium transporter 2-like isoform X1 [Daphnia pulex]|uniref:ammonium transporter 2-like isoform X1 n=1 Tax=Daphnia pulex TaxID=6669 RepID=UPI001EDCC4AF|nr:ammonium transporter 2-like isoform X1 [Daphnia pulex]
MEAAVLNNDTALLMLLEAKLAITQSNLNDFFITVSAILVFACDLCNNLAMQAGFSLMETGLVRSKNATNILMKSTLDAFIGATVYWLVGYAFAYGDGNEFIGWTGFALQGVSPSKLSFWFYQTIFANTASTIVSGATAERINLPAFFIYAFLLTGFFYPVASRWVWHPSGWLKIRGFIDFGGSGCVHMLGGVCALVACVMVGPRTGRYENKTKKKFAFRGHSNTLTGVGAFLLMMGILGYNMSAQLDLTHHGDGVTVALSAVNTILAGSAGSIVATILGRATPTGSYRWSYNTMLNGAIAGMVSSCAACNAMPYWGAYLTGAGAGFLFFVLRALINHLHVDDPLDAFAVHFGGGFFGMLSAPILVNSGVILTGDESSAEVLGWQLIGILVLVAWGVGFCLVLFGSLKYFKILRVDSTVEVQGMDSMKHGEPAYPAESWEEQQYWDHQVHRLIHLMRSTSIESLCGNQKNSIATVDLGVNNNFRLTGMPPQMNFAHLVLTDYFQKCVFPLDSQRTCERFRAQTVTGVKVLNAEPAP